jgi:hypothetical protein
MTVALPAFTPIEDTLFLTLCGRTLDSRLPHPILGDVMAEEIVNKLDYDYDKFHLSTSPIINIAHRAKKLDDGAELLQPPPERGRARSRGRAGHTDVPHRPAAHRRLV